MRTKIASCCRPLFFVAPAARISSVVFCIVRIAALTTSS
jgi:hypothetical protein